MIYRNQDELMPVRVVTTGYDDHLFRICLPSVVHTTVKNWVFDDDDGGAQTYFQFMVINPNTALASGVPRGCKLFHVTHQSSPPFQAVRVSTGLATTTDLVNSRSFIAPIVATPNAIPLFIWETMDTDGNRVTRAILQPRTLREVYEHVRTPYRHIVLYLYPNQSFVGWAFNSEYLCYPLVENHDGHYHNHNVFESQSRCVDSAADFIQNKVVWVNDSNIIIKRYTNWWNDLPESLQRKSLGLSNSNSFVNPFGVLIVLVVVVVAIVVFAKKSSTSSHQQGRRP